MDLLALQTAIRQDDVFASPHAVSAALADSLSIDDV